MALLDIFIFYGMVGLFIVSFLSSLIPIPTEAVVFGLLGAGGDSGIIFIILTLGSILGAFLGYLIGKHGLTKLIQSYKNKEKQEQTNRYFLKYGAFLLLVSPWIPFVCNLAPVVAGIQNYDSKRFLIIISIANIIKCFAIVYLSITIIDWWTLFMK
ncbi:SNARE associated Golgi protein [uncultured archaeon]|nr:SNARE associated Golgi protein [uncultured archaeon]